MRIWIVNHYALPPGSTGGPTRHLGISRALRDRGHDVTIVASLFDHYSRTDHRPRQGRRRLVEDVDGVTYVWIPTPRYQSTRGRVRNMVSMWASLVRGLNEVPAPDVVIGSSPHLLTPLAAQVLARRSGVPFVLEIRDLWPQSLVDLGDMGTGSPVVRVLEAIERRLYRSSDQIITVLPEADAHFRAQGARGTVHVVPNGVEVGPVVSKTRSDRFTALYAGTMGHANGLDLAADAAEILGSRGRDDICVRLVGGGPEHARLLDRSRSIDNLSVEGPVRSDDVPRLLATADVGLLILRESPVFRWGISPTKLFDYFAASLPVVTSVSTPTDIASAIGAGVRAIPGDPVSLADAIETLAGRTVSERLDMGSRGRRYVEENHSFDRLARRMEEILELAMAEGNAVT